MALSKQRIGEIETKAEDILREVYGDLANVELPVDLTQIANQYGIDILSATFTERNISGLYDKNDRKIHVASDDYFPRQLFTIGHELGHYFLHASKRGEIFYRADALNIDTKKPAAETEADWFSASLLMPRRLVEEYWRLMPSPERLAETFVVSETAMRWRLINVGLLEYSNGGAK